MLYALSPPSKTSQPSSTESHHEVIIAEFNSDPKAFLELAIDLDLAMQKDMGDVERILAGMMRKQEQHLPNSLHFILASEEIRQTAIRTLAFAMGEKYRDMDMDNAAVSCFMDAANHGCKVALRAKEKMYLEGKGRGNISSYRTFVDIYEDVVRYLNKAAFSSDEARYQLGVIEEELGNRREAIAHYQFLIDKKNSQALNRLGALYFKQDKWLAKTYFLMAVIHGPHHATTNGHCKLVLQEYEKNEAIDPDDLYATSELYRQKNNLDQARLFLQCAADLNHTKGQCDLGMLNLMQSNEAENDADEQALYVSALKYLYSAHKNGSAAATYQLILLYMLFNEQGKLNAKKGVLPYVELTKNTEELDWFTSIFVLPSNYSMQFIQCAAEEDHPDAACELGQEYQSRSLNRGIFEASEKIEDENKALHFYKMALGIYAKNKGSDKRTNVAYFIGQIYESRIGIFLKNEIAQRDAICYYQMAATASDHEASLARAALQRLGVTELKVDYVPKIKSSPRDHLASTVMTTTEKKGDGEVKILDKDQKKKLQKGDLHEDL